MRCFSPIDRTKKGNKMSYIKIINETKECEVFLNENPDEEQIADLTEQGFIEGEWERGWDGFPYAKGYAPEKPQSVINAERIAELQSLLNSTDWYAIRFAETGVEIPDNIKKERQAARDEISRLRDESEEE